MNDTNPFADRAQRLLLPAVHAQQRKPAPVPELQGCGGYSARPRPARLHRPPQHRGRRAAGLSTFNNFRVVLGAKGSFYEDKWDYNAWWQIGQELDVAINTSTTSRCRASAKAFNVVPDTRPTPDPGAPVCASVVDGTDANCVPYDIFHLGGVTQAALNYLQTPGMRSGYTAQSVVGVNVSSDLGSAYGWTLPWAKDGIGFAAGIERRVEKLSNNVDAEYATGDLAGQGGATLSVQRRVHASWSRTSNSGCRSSSGSRGRTTSPSPAPTATRTTAPTRRRTATASAPTGRPSGKPSFAAATSRRCVRRTSSSSSSGRASTCSAARIPAPVPRPPPRSSNA